MNLSHHKQLDVQYRTSCATLLPNNVLYVFVSLEICNWGHTLTEIYYAGASPFTRNMCFMVNLLLVTYKLFMGLFIYES